jgi:hypothetical protein
MGTKLCVKIKNSEKRAIVPELIGQDSPITRKFHPHTLELNQS